MLSLAVREGNKEIVRVLLEHGADPLKVGGRNPAYSALDTAKMVYKSCLEDGAVGPEILTERRKMELRYGQRLKPNAAGMKEIIKILEEAAKRQTA